MFACGMAVLALSPHDRFQRATAAQPASRLGLDTEGLSVRGMHTCSTLSVSQAPFCTHARKYAQLLAYLALAVDRVFLPSACKGAGEEGEEEGGGGGGGVCTQGDLRGVASYTRLLTNEILCRIEQSSRIAVRLTHNATCQAIGLI